LLLKSFLRSQQTPSWSTAYCRNFTTSSMSSQPCVITGVSVFFCHARAYRAGTAHRWDRDTLERPSKDLHWSFVCISMQISCSELSLNFATSRLQTIELTV